MSIKLKKKKTVRIDCDTCTFPTKAEGNCPAKELECFGCGKTGHFSGSKVCKKKKEKKDFKDSDKKKKKEEKKKVSKSRKVKESDEDSDWS